MTAPPMRHTPIARVVSIDEARRRLAETFDPSAEPERVNAGWCGAPDCTGNCAPTDDMPPARSARAGKAIDNHGLCPICGKIGTRGLPCLACEAVVRSGETRIEYR